MISFFFQHRNDGIFNLPRPGMAPNGRPAPGVPQAPGHSTFEAGTGRPNKAFRAFSLSFVVVAPNSEAGTDWLQPPHVGQSIEPAPFPGRIAFLNCLIGAPRRLHIGLVAKFFCQFFGIPEGLGMLMVQFINGHGVSLKMPLHNNAARHEQKRCPKAPLSQTERGWSLKFGFHATA
jgi:hypothetical protein